MHAVLGENGLNQAYGLELCDRGYIDSSIRFQTRHVSIIAYCFTHSKICELLHGENN